MHKWVLVLMMAPLNVIAAGPEIVSCDVTLRCAKDICGTDKIIFRETRAANFLRDDGLQWIAFWRYDLGGIRLHVTPTFSGVGGAPVQEIGSYTFSASEGDRELAFSYVEKVFVGQRFFQRFRLAESASINGKTYQQVSLMCVSK